MHIQNGIAIFWSIGHYLVMVQSSAKSWSYSRELNRIILVSVFNYKSLGNKSLIRAI